MRLHHIAIAAVNLVAVLLILGMLMGAEIKMPEILHVDRTIRDLCIALWSFVIPAWFVLETATFCPRTDDLAAKTQFYENQRVGQMWATFVGTVVAIILGLSSLPASDAAAAFEKQATQRSER